MTNLATAHEAGATPVDYMHDESVQEFIGLTRLSEQQIALVKARSQADKIGFLEAAIAAGVVTREDLMAALARKYNYPIIQPDSGLSRFSRELAIGHEPFSEAAETIRSIRTSIVSTAIGQSTHAFVLVAPRKAHGASFLAGNLAVAFAQMSVSALLVDANLRDPRISAMFGIPLDREGLSDALLHKKTDHPPIMHDVLPGLSILPSGGAPPNPQELLCSGEFMALCDNLARNYGVVIYDSPAAMEYGDAYIIAARVGAAIIAARQDHASFADLKQVSDKLRAHHCLIVGSIANCF
jgi:protein-tyrosine kinase